MSADLARSEAGVLGALLADEFGESMPPVIEVLLRHAPHSFEDQRFGMVASAIRRVRQNRVQVCWASVKDALAEANQLDAIGGTEGLAAIELGAVDRRSAEYEAEALAEAFRVRQLKATFEKAAAELTASPQLAADIATRTAAIMADLDGRGDADADLLRLADAAAFNVDCRPDEARPRFFVHGVPVSTEGNLAVITAPSKAGKSAFVAAMMAATMTKTADAVDTLGVSASNSEGLALLHFDTEQSRQDHDALIRTTLRRANIDAPPTWFASHSLAGWNAPELRRLIPLVIHRAAEKCGGVHSVFLDGVADAVIDVNDAAEANEFVMELHRLAIDHRCAIVSVLHYNPGTEKSRGHLGSQLERKAEANLKLEVDGTGATIVFADKNRRAPILKSTGPRFIWSSAEGMHASTSSHAAVAGDAKRETLRPMVEEVFAGRGGLRYSEAKNNFMKLLKLKEGTAERRFREALQFGLIRKVAANLYVQAT